MDKFFNQYADLTAVILAFLLPLIVTVVMKRKAGRKVRVLFAYFLFFGPCGMLVFIFFHLFENGYRAVVAATTGTFVYNFNFYSRILMGVVVAGIGYFFLKACWVKCVREKNNNQVILQIILLIAIVTGPLIPFTPIAAVPLICCVFHLIGLPFVRRKMKTFSIIQLNEGKIATTG